MNERRRTQPQKTAEGPPRPVLHLLVDPPVELGGDPSGRSWAGAVWDVELLERLRQACDDELDDALIAWIVERMRLRGRIEPTLCWLDGRRRACGADGAAVELSRKLAARRRWGAVPTPAVDDTSADPSVPSREEGAVPATGEESIELERVEESIARRVDEGNEAMVFEAYRHRRDGDGGFGLRCSQILLGLERGQADAARALWQEDEAALRRPRLARSLRRWLEGGHPPILLGE